MDLTLAVRRLLFEDGMEMRFGDGYKGEDTCYIYNPVPGQTSRSAAVKPQTHSPIVAVQSSRGSDDSMPRSARVYRALNLGFPRIAQTG